MYIMYLMSYSHLRMRKYSLSLKLLRLDYSLNVLSPKQNDSLFLLRIMCCLFSSYQ